MKHIQQPNDATCFITSIAMMWDQTDPGGLLVDLFGLIGHDGSEVLWPELTGWEQYRGHSLDEIMYCAIMMGRDCRIINRISECGHNWADKKMVKTPYNWEAIIFHEPTKPRVLLNDRHAICWCDFVTYDPNRLYPSQMPLIANDWDMLIV